MNPMEFDGSLVRERNEDLLREVRKQRLERRPRAKDEAGPREVKDTLPVVGRIASILAMATVMAMAIVSSPALANHEHYLLTPGTCVEDVAGGQTAKGPGEGGHHKFHDNVHKGRPGTAAFENDSNPVAVDKGPCPGQ